MRSCLNAAIDCCTREITGWALDVRRRAPVVATPGFGERFRTRERRHEAPLRNFSSVEGASVEDVVVVAVEDDVFAVVPGVVVVAVVVLHLDRRARIKPKGEPEPDLDVAVGSLFALLPLMSSTLQSNPRSWLA